MKALRFHAAKDLRIEEVDAPPSPGPGEVLVENRFCGICGTDLHEYAYGPIFVPKEPHPFTGAHGPQSHPERRMPPRGTRRACPDRPWYCLRP